MGVFLTNTTTLSYCVEQSPGVLSGSEDWFQLEPDSIGAMGATITTVARNPINKKRMDRKGTTTDLDSTVDFTSDLTVASFNNFIDGFLYSVIKTQVETEPTSVAGASKTYTHASITTLSAGTLIFARDFVNSTNNGLKIVDSATATTTVVLETLVDDGTPASGAKFDVAGFQGASGDIQVDVSGDLISDSAYNFITSDLNFYPGQWIYVGGTAAGTFFDTAGSGFARITTVTASKLTLDKQKSSTWAEDDGSGKTIQIFTGSFVRNVPVCDGDFQKKTYQFEAEYTDAECSAQDYEYAIGNSANSMTVNVPLSDKATVDWGFIGLDTETADVRKTISTPEPPYDTTAYNTTSDIAEIYLAKEDGTELSAYFKSLTLTLDNGVTPVKVLGTLGSVGINLANFTVTGSAQILFDDLEAINATRDNETVTMDFTVANDDGALYFDIPSMTLGGTSKSFDRDEEIKLDIDGNAFEDNFFGYVLGVTIFPYTPA